jgi:ABC-type antimicrobial peptide transport system permease subunit
MAKETLHFKSKHTGKLKKAPVGYSWTTLFFTAFVPLLRGDWKWAVIMMLIILVLGGSIAAVAPNAPVQSVSVWVGIILGFFYNKSYIKGLISNDYEVTSVEQGEIDATQTKLGLTLPLAE